MVTVAIILIYLLVVLFLFWLADEVGEVFGPRRSVRQQKPKRSGNGKDGYSLFNHARCPCQHLVLAHDYVDGKPWCRICNRTCEAIQ